MPNIAESIQERDSNAVSAGGSRLEHGLAPSSRPVAIGRWMAGSRTFPSVGQEAPECPTRRGSAVPDLFFPQCVCS